MRLNHVLSFLLFLFVLPAGVFASGAWHEDEVWRARLVSSIASIPADATSMRGGLEIELKDGWKIYWRSPGDAGLPPDLNFSASPEVIDTKMFFPRPKRFSILGFDSFGYENRVIYPLDFQLRPSSSGVMLQGNFSGLVCKDICIPIAADLSLNLPSGHGEASAEARDIAFFSSKVPKIITTAEKQEHISVASLAVKGDGLSLNLQQGGESYRLNVIDEALIETTIGGVSFAKAQLQGGEIFIKVDGLPAQELLNQPVTVTVISDDVLFEEKVIVTDASAVALVVSDGIALIVFIAFLGGLILNVMPCVLPVLSLKLASVISLGGQDHRVVRRSFLATASGIVVSFLLLGGSLFALRQAGFAIGWGIQFQNPYFLAIAAVMVTGFALMMLDIIIVPLPQFLTRIGKEQKGLWGDFLSGFMATLLATPCSAPFVGTAITFALTSQGLGLMLIFLAMGLGLAMPWLLVAALPQVAQYLPKPGRWLIHAKRILAFGLFLTALWLLSVLFTIVTNSDKEVTGDWQEWSPSRLATLQAEGKTVLVDITADWCLTCKANKIFVLDSKAVQDYITNNDIVLLQGDWTQPDTEIKAFLTQYNRFGIPFNIVYGKGVEAGIILPELLTQDKVIAALTSAADLQSDDNLK